LSGVRGERATNAAELFPEFLIWAIVGVFAIGVCSTIGLIAVMKHYGFELALISGFALSIFVLMLVIEAVFIGLLLSQKTSAKEVSRSSRLPQQTTNELEQPAPRTLPEPLPSVTEHTTRAFEPINRKQKAE
jgi:hypothetical protein